MFNLMLFVATKIVGQKKFFPLFWLLDPGSGMDKYQDPGSGINTARSHFIFTGAASDQPGARG
jgi:hypothetical protein